MYIFILGNKEMTPVGHYFQSQEKRNRILFSILVDQVVRNTKGTESSN